MGSVTSIKDGRRYIPVHDLCSSLSSITCEILWLVVIPLLLSLVLGNNLFLSWLNLHLLSVRTFHSLRIQILNPQYVLQEKLWQSCMTQKQSISLDTPIWISYVSDLLPAKTAPLFTFHQVNGHLNNTSWELPFKTWMTSHQAKSPVASPYDYGWQKGSNGPTPIVFSGLMSSDFL
jgi:hypothetical protein